MDKSPYRNNEEEIKNRKDQDPISFAKEVLIKDNLLDSNEIKKIDEIISLEMDEAMNYAINSPLNDTEEIFNDVYSNDMPSPKSVDERIKNILSIK